MVLMVALVLWRGQKATGCQKATPQVLSVQDERRWSRKQRKHMSEDGWYVRESVPDEGRARHCTRQPPFGWLFISPSHYICKFSKNYEN